MSDIIKLEPIKTQRLGVTLVGETPLIAHRWSEKAKRMIREKHAGKKTRLREVRDPEAEFREASYVLSDGSHGIPATGIKKAMHGAAHKDLGIPKTVLSRGLFIIADETPVGEHPLCRLDCAPPIMREDVVRVGQGSTDLRYRPEYRDWKIHIKIKFDPEWLGAEAILGLLERAGFGIGFGEWRAERSGDFGRFYVDRESVTLSKNVREVHAA